MLVGVPDFSVSRRDDSSGGADAALAAWSSMAGSWLRKHGMPALHGNGSRFPITLNGSMPIGDGLAEGPFDAVALEPLGLGATEHVAEWVEILPTGTETLGEVGFATDLVRRIPAARGERSDPYRWTSPHAILSTPPLRVQFLRLSDGWDCLAEGKLADGSRGCIVARRGGLTLVGFPFLAMLVRHHWMPPVDDGYYSVEGPFFNEAADLWLADLVASSAAAAGMRVVRASPWPAGMGSALTVRFDHDRAISEASLQDMLGLLDSYGMKASWGFLARLSDPSTIDAVARRGHEIVLHSEAATRASLRQELDHFKSLGHDIRGVTAHGGIGSAGHLGQRLYEWASAEGLEHADILSRDAHLPHPALAATADGITELPVYLPPGHCSLDVGTKPEAHALPALLDDIPRRLDRGGLVTIMNHPDIHREELRTLLGSLDLSRVWRASHLDAVRRVRAVTERSVLGDGQRA